MKIEQVHQLVNNLTKEHLGQEDVAQADLSNVVDVGKSLVDAIGTERLARSLPDHIGRMMFVDRIWEDSNSPDIYMDSWEWGSILEKIKPTKIQDAEEDEMWDLQDMTSYDPNVFHKPFAEAKFYNHYDAFKITYPSIGNTRLMSAFDNPTQLNAFISMLWNHVGNSLKVKIKALKLSVLNNMIGETLYSSYNSGSSFSGSSKVKAVNLLYEYNQIATTPITADDAILDPDFIRYASFRMMSVEKRLKDYSVLFNVNEQPRFTNDVRCILHQDFANAAGIYLYSDTFHKELVALPNAKTVSFWQGSGDEYAFEDTSKVVVKTSGNHDVTATGILGVMFERQALGITCLDQHVSSHYNGEEEFTNNWLHYKAGYFNDFDENFVVFFVA